MEIIRGRLSAKDVSNPSMRYNPTTDTVQYSPDNGANWYNAPEADPRHSDIFRLPGLTTSDPQCDAAANMVKWIKDFIDSVIASLDGGATALTLTNNFLERFATLFPPALLLLLLAEAAESLFTTGSEALADAFTSDQYDLLLCAFFCNIGADGQCSADQLADVEVQIAATMNSTAAAIVDEILFIQGEVGLSNAGVIGGETGDCSACECAWCRTWDLSLGSGDGITVTFNTYGAVTSNGLQSTLYGSDSQVLSANIVWDASVIITEMDIEYSTGHDANGGNRQYHIKLGSTTVRNGFFSTGVVTNSVIVEGFLPYPTEIDQITFNCDTAGFTNPNWMSRITLKGTGDPPSGGVDCS